MIKKIHHISDVHIRLLKRHNEYKAVFDNLYTEIKKHKENSIIVVTGDILHAKTEMSPELIDMTTDFFNKLASITQTILILGNHDCNLNNASRMDSISPIVDALNNKNLILLKETQLFEIDNLIFANMAISDEKEKYIHSYEIDSDKTKIALYHGVVNGASFGGFLTKHASMELADFDGYDMALLGDIHISQRLQELDVLAKKPEIWYAGACLQQSYGESADKGYLLWDVDSRKPEFIKIPNEYGYHTIELNNGQYSIPTDFSSKPRIRIKVSETSATDLHRICTDLRKVFAVQEIIVTNVDRTDDQTLRERKHGLIDVRNVEIQNKLIGDFVKSKYSITDVGLLSKIYTINSNTNKELLQNETIRNTVWAPKKFEFGNMFSYGEGNVIDFSKLKNIIGLFAPNASGKSAVMDSLTFCIFDKSPRAYKGINILNNRKLSFHCKFNFEIDGMDFFIERRGVRNKLGNVKVDVDFWTIGDDGQTISLNGNDRDETNQNIRGYVGSFDDFTSTAMAFQGNTESFIEKTQTERKDLLAKFLDIGIFDDLYRIASEKTRDMNVLLNEFKKQDFTTKLSELEEQFESGEILSQKYSDEKTQLESQEKKFNGEIVKESQNKIKIDLGPIDIEKCEITIKECSSKIKEFEIKHVAFSDSIVEYKTKALKTFEEIKGLTDLNTEELYCEYTNVLKKYNSINSTLDKEKIKIDNKRRILKDLEKHEYDPNCKYCVDNIFVKNAIKTKGELISDEKNYTILVSEVDEFKSKVDQLKKHELDYSVLTTLNKALDAQKLSALKFEYEKNTIEKELQGLNHKVSDAKSQIDIYEKNKILIEHNSKIDKKIVEIKKCLDDALTNKKDTEKRLQESISKTEVAKSEMVKIHDLVNNATEMENNFEAYELYTKSINREGVPYDLIANTIPHLQEEVNDILSQLVEFNILFNLDGKNINAYIVYGDDKMWPIELVSGMEKFVSSLAIRCALLNISNLPHPTFLAIDEGFGVMDSDNMSSLGYLFDYLKTKFEFVLIVSHIDNMKDMVDYVLDISKEDGYSKIDFS